MEDYDIIIEAEQDSESESDSDDGNIEMIDRVASKSHKEHCKDCPGCVFVRIQHADEFL